MIVAVTFWTNAGASAATIGGRLILLSAAAGTSISCRWAMAWSTAW